ncbi:MULTISPECIES: SDR family NAD(P)-dependent oxidoreductase [Pseudomonas]|jgi:NAD(P)-dependent dehydrogenase (short-subunit alcohol dehydrogenase family)|uniref:SDR family NAD(P)-dependent oxidoreductase n=2 Tax=Pseudomonas TaxID=286 RepID=A0AAW5HFI5_PSEPU|nr:MULTISPECIES: SDR family NAD(P)-dependent oxidoreductase [Pseudomonas]MCO1620338.1 SDR family NAD(P)-dependent oxidoreductase [Pseudomonas putida]MCT8950706.1 SDR family NAD(P)-dependent oxidoreductase [Pseudomonas iridis]MCU9532668.1 SDR family NAD(P)-dependent oxidoreductase [Pseudomonas mosselii]MCU9540061.1 SDR family NAD(P)-dependent oxidoreductase [Pseudomonas mosselii]MCU9545966.1 SDR family NAD(P)-dependent oxidoreductase [Pseudomonas mosselii]
MIAGRHSGRNVLVSGAASGIGPAVAQRYCEEGATVALLDLNPQPSTLNPQALQAQGERLRAQGFVVTWHAVASHYSATQGSHHRVHSTPARKTWGLWHYGQCPGP